MISQDLALLSTQRSRSSENQNKPVELNLEVTCSSTMHEQITALEKAAATKISILLLGETGVGKSAFASYVHRKSPRHQGPFISLNCGALSKDLLESELFGHERGAFTGAYKAKRGRFELAHKGTLFLDEISNLSLEAQGKLLQALQEARFQRVGGEQDIHVDVRFIAASNDNLSDLVQKGRFRRDLFFRLNVFPIQLPPLRERPEDIPTLVQHILPLVNLRLGTQIRSASLDLIEFFQNYDWPGNVRELENVIEQACILENSTTLTLESIPSRLRNLSSPSTLVVDTQESLSLARKRIVEEFEKEYLKKLLSETRGCIKNIALRAGISVRQVHNLMVKYGLEKSRFRLPEQASTPAFPQKDLSRSSCNNP